jgi:hypothetical protein
VRIDRGREHAAPPRLRARISAPVRAGQTALAWRPAAPGHGKADLLKRVFAHGFTAELWTLRQGAMAIERQSAITPFVLQI